MNQLDAIQVSIHHSIATFTIARQAKRNALDTACWQALLDACNVIAARDDIKVVVLTGEGAHFCAGADIGELSIHINDATWMTNNQATIAAALDAYAALPQPTIAKIRGACIGGGAALAAASDFRYCSPDARFAITPAKLGLTYRLVDCLRVVDLVGSTRAREILLLAKELDAATALHWAFVTDVVGADSLNTKVDEIVTQLAALSSTSHRGIKQSLLKIRAGQTNDDAQTIETFQNAFTGADFAEGAAAFIDKRAAEFKGAH